jgi:hypothetical protein
MRKYLRWVPRIILLLALGLWMSAYFVRANVCFFQHGREQETWRSNEWERIYTIFGLHSLFVQTEPGGIHLTYLRMGKTRDAQPRPALTFSQGADPSFWQLGKPYIKNTRLLDPDEMQQDYVTEAMTPDKMPPGQKKQLQAALQANGMQLDPLAVWYIPHPVGPPHKRGPIDPDEQILTFDAGIPYWLMALLAAIIPSVEVLRWWRRGRKEGRGFDVKGATNA